MICYDCYFKPDCSVDEFFLRIIHIINAKGS
ncbi:unnamed protein product [Schistosoma margrebowiei]|uniref:Uncharacterized protein n=1 Tax=Schistosoma margrebowiei TaxID=48269 RepID=A0A3P7ZBE6_9TREM|nr:unnamed protein product [Schistosoma margrebowiei]